MAQDIAGKGAMPGQGGKLAMPDEGLCAYDGIVPPVLGIAKEPEMHARRKDRAVKVIGKRLDARDEAVHVHRERRGLQDIF